MKSNGTRVGMALLRIPQIVRLVILGLSLLAVAPAAAPAIAQDPQLPPTTESMDRAGGNLLIRVRTSNGASVPSHAMVWLTARMGPVRLSESTRDNAEVLFRDLPLGEYEVRVQAPGFAVANSQVDVLLPSGTTDIFIYLLPESAAGAAYNPAGAAVLAPKARKEFEKGIAALRANNLKQAQESLEKTLKLAPGYPEVNYALGVLFIRLNDLGRARDFLLRATELEPAHVSALATLASVQHRLIDYQAAVRTLDRLLTLEPGGWKVHWLMAASCFMDNQLEKAQTHAERAIELSQGQAQELQVFYAEILDARGALEKALGQAEAFLRNNLEHTAAPRARQLAARIRKTRAETARAASVPPAAELPPRRAAPVPAIEPALPETRWAPADVDESRPEVSPGVTCALPDVLGATARRTKTLVDSLQRITATERIEHSELDAAGNTRSQLAVTSEYIVSIQSLRNSNLVVDESRTETGTQPTLPFHRTNGLVALAVIFHPYYVADFAMTCAGLGQWRGEPAWIVDFRQRRDRPSRVRAYHTREGRFPVNLKGRAWIAANNHHVLRFESDLLEHATGLPLEREHLIIEYAPVKFLQRNELLWLPASADLYARFRGRRYHQRHSFSNFMLFSVDIKKQVADPKLP